MRGKLGRTGSQQERPPGRKNAERCPPCNEQTARQSASHRGEGSNGSAAAAATGALLLLLLGLLRVGPRLRRPRALIIIVSAVVGLLVQPLDLGKQRFLRIFGALLLRLLCLRVDAVQHLAPGNGWR